MAELDSLVVQISADDAAFVRTLNKDNKFLKDFAATGTATADQLSKALSSIRRASQKATDPKDVEQLAKVYVSLNKQLEVVQNNIAELSTVTDSAGNSFTAFGPKIKKSLSDADEASRRARIAVYGLNQVVRDAPFGFIAISNNIPVLIDQLQELVKTKGSTKAAFKEFALGLLGAGGVSVAISAVISLITSAVQKYGSLSNAVTALTTDLGPLIERLNESNKSYETFLKKSLTLPEVRTISTISSDAEVARLDNLIRGLRDENKTRAEKEAILKRIQQLDSGIFQGYELQVSKLGNVIQALELYKSSLRNTTAEKNYTKQLTDTVDKLGEQQLELDNLNARVAQADAEFNKLNNRLNKLQVNAPGYELLAERVNKAATSLKQLTALQTEQRNRVQSLIIQQSQYGTSVDNAANQQITSIAKVNEFVAANFKKIGNEQDKANKKRVAGNITALQAQLAQEKSYLNTLNNLSKDFEDQQIKIATLERDIKAAQLQQQIVDRKQLSDAIKSIDIDLQNEITNIISDGVTRRVSFWKEEAKAAKIAAEEAKKAFDAIPKVAPDYTKIISGNEIKKALEIVDGYRKEITEREKARLQELTDQALLFANAIGNFTGDFVQGLLDGESAIEGLIDGMKKLAKEIAVAAAKAIALELVYQALNIASAGTGTAAKTGVGLFQNLFGRGGVAAPANIGTGLPIGPGGLAIRGNVTFVQRGQDLVGVLARSNARINRVG